MNRVRGYQTDVAGERFYAQVVESLRTPLLRLHTLAQCEDTKEELSAVAYEALKVLDSLSIIERQKQAQTSLLLEPVSMTNVFDDVFHSLSKSFAFSHVQIENRTSKNPVLAHRPSIQRSLEHLVRAFAYEANQNSSKIIAHSRSYGARTDIGVYLSTNGSQAQILKEVRSGLTPKKLRTLCASEKKLHIVLADLLLYTHHSELRPSLFKTSGGLAFGVAKSTQLQLLSI